MDSLGFGYRFISCLVGAFLFFGPAIAQPPTISAFSPASGPVGTVVTITGTNMSAVPADNIVYFGATRANVQSASALQLTVAAPPGATFQPISLTVNGLTAFSGKPFLPSFQNTNDNYGFEPSTNLPAGNNPQFVQIGDVDGDGKPDLMVANTDGDSISIFRNISTNGTLNANSFAPRVDFLSNLLPWSIAFGDLDGDGKPDLAVAGGGSYAISIFRNVSSSGSITLNSLATRVDLGFGIGAESVIIDDLDGDGKPDLATANYANSTISIFRNQSSPGAITAASFEAPVSLVAGNTPQKIVVGDLNGDGKKDLAVSNRNANTISVFRNTSTPGTITTSSFDAKVDFVTGNRSDSYPSSLAIGDLDGDDKQDLAVANLNGASISIFKGTGNTGPVTSSTFDAKVDFEGTIGPNDVAMSDLNGDGKLDLVTANSYFNNVSLLLNTSTSGTLNINSFASPIDLATGVNNGSIAIGDLDGDDKPDMAVSHASTSDFGISLIHNSTITGIADTDLSIALFPTIARSTLMIKGWQPGGSSLAIYDLNGKVTLPYFRPEGDLVEVDVRSLTPGLYGLRLTGNPKVFRFVKE